jgi:hypothetical protein
MWRAINRYHHHHMTFMDYTSKILYRAQNPLSIVSLVFLKLFVIYIYDSVYKVVPAFAISKRALPSAILSTLSSSEYQEVCCSCTCLYNQQGL